MDKPRATIKTEYDLIEILEYAEKEHKGFKRAIWKELCESNYINNDTSTWIPFEDFADEEYYSSIIVDGAKYIMSEIPDVLSDGVVFHICW